MGAAFEWTEEAVTTARELWPHETAAFIAELLGCSRNAVIGKMIRLGVEKPKKKPAKPKPAPKPKIVCASVKDAAGAHPVGRLDIEVEIGPITPAAAVAFADLRASHCRWVVGGADGLDTLFCGKAKACPHSWCAEHRGIVYQPRQRRHG